MNRFTFPSLAILLSLAILVACSDAEPVAVTFQDVCEQKADTLVAIEGHLRLRASTLCRKGAGVGGRTYCELGLYPEPGGEGEPIQVSIYVGDEPNHMLLVPEEYTWEDLVIQTEGGATVGHDARVRITGPVSGACVIYVRKIKVP